MTWSMCVHTQLEIIGDTYWQYSIYFEYIRYISSTYNSEITTTICCYSLAFVPTAHVSVPATIKIIAVSPFTAQTFLNLNNSEYKEMANVLKNVIS